MWLKIYERQQSAQPQQVVNLSDGCITHIFHFKQNHLIFAQLDIYK